MIEIKAYKIGMALFFYCKCLSIEHKTLFSPMLMATSMVVFLLKHPKLLQELKYKQLYDELLELQTENVYFGLKDFGETAGDSLDRNTLRGVAEMINDIELQDKHSKIYKLKTSDINEFISHYFY